jgi:amino acid adenylation domain-containing protein
MPLVLTAREYVARLRGIGIPEEKIVSVDEPMRGDLAHTERWRSIIDTDPVYIIHTSGSTGTPKGVIIPHRGVIDYIDWAKDTFSVDSSCVIGSQAPFVFDNSTLDLYLCFACGATLCLIPEELYSFPLRLAEHMAAHRINFIFWVPSIMVSMANANVLDAVPDLSLTKVLFAGEVMPARTLNIWRRRFTKALFANLYGPTEITVDCTCYITDRDLSDDEPVPIGRPCRNTGILILNEHDLPCAPNEPGELCVRGSSLALGYWNNAEKTSTAFVQNPCNSRYPERIYRTGDLAYLNERGEIIFVGRRDSQIKHMGYRIELGEIEHFAVQVAGIRNACVLYDQPRKQIVLVYEADADIAAAVIRTELGRNLAKYMWPTVLHRVAEMPRNPSGKIDRQRLAGEFIR